MRGVVILIACLILAILPGCLSQPRLGPDTPLGQIYYDMWGRPRLHPDPTFLDTTVPAREKLQQFDEPKSGTR